MLRPPRLLTVLLACCIFLFIGVILSSSAPSPSPSPSYLPSSYTPRRPTSLRTRVNTYYHTKNDQNSLSSPSSPGQEDLQSSSSDNVQRQISSNKVTRQLRSTKKSITKPTSLPAKNPVTSPAKGDHQQQQQQQQQQDHYGSKRVQENETRYLMYIPYAGITNQLISIWHGSLIAKALNRTLLIPNLSPNVHVEISGDEQTEPAPSRWSEFFDLEYYSEKTGLKLEELDTFLAKRGIVERSSVPEDIFSINNDKNNDNINKNGSGRRMKRSLSIHQDKGFKERDRKRKVNKRWIQLGSPIVSSSSTSSSPSLFSSSSSTSTSTSTDTLTLNYRTNLSPSSAAKKVPVFRPVKFPAVQKCFSEAGYGADHRIDMTGRQFQQRYNIDPQLIPTPYLDPENDNKTIWSRWRMDKVIERYQQPEYNQQEILCLGHVYRLLPGGVNRAWVEFGQHFRYTEKVEHFIDEILEKLLPRDQTEEQAGNVESVQQDRGFKDQDTEVHAEIHASSPQPFIGVHLRRGDFYHYCLGITSPADPNGWNRCYPSTDHIISLVNSFDFRSSSSRSLSDYSTSIVPSYDENINPALVKRQQHLSESVIDNDNNSNNRSINKPKKPPVLVLTNERDPAELAKADSQGWIRVDHERLGTLERFGRYGPILIDGALLARATLLIGVEYSTYFRTASKRAETWYAGQTLLVT
ncbi:hypothetical protein BX616_002719 [Lobosporangium transversale]|uniref:GDP-fucose protein O-fucosyltransferase 2 n=1 Tax=Lobosporangium transversale TaxID=64571 RepID=A0A1Y2H1M5_9FUNG|nr:hypothetical protein BCR41DRAFT_345378 [Lobosporangium transversale]KAF9900077.1 hypothetical protein BX616_002719 [Lobosporangium transversale]ORZ28469.1 hypothetical protein BCR41DRAFT_345378 [Lobosporangium transversale]|eukprot:XP_021886154.1 hypothetical protein BCR41DRAFT_345378 [Lobosporangium transversale]